jgi:nitroreductase
MPGQIRKRSGPKGGYAFFVRLISRRLCPLRGGKPVNADNPLIQAIRARRSVRHYRRQPLSKDILATIVDCGRLAPSANNVQAWEFVVVTEPATLKQLAELATYGKFIADAAACIVVCGDPVNRSIYLDGAAATENMLLAIHSLGLASCWVQAFEKDYNPAIKSLLGVPDRLVLIALVPVAAPAKDVRQPPKRSVEQVLHWEKF